MENDEIGWKIKLVGAMIAIPALIIYLQTIWHDLSSVLNALINLVNKILWGG